jgi:hypoxanthine phosphoribosyltransferase
LAEEKTSLKVLLTTEQISKRVKELARQISEDYRGKTLHAICVLENGFIFMADLVRGIEVPVVCQFMKPQFTEVQGPTASASTTEIFFTPEPNVKGQEVLLIEGLVQSGVTSEFLIRTMMARGAKSVKLVAFLDKQKERRVSLQPDYFGFLIDESYVVGYGLGSPHLGRNLPYVASGLPNPATAAAK